MKEKSSEEIKQLLDNIVIIEGENLKIRKDEIIKELEELIKSHPFASVAVAALIGYILGKMK